MSSAGTDATLQLAEVRTVQKKLGILVCSTDMPNDMKTELRAIMASIATQEKANVIVDKVIDSETTDIIETRLTQIMQ